MWYTGPWRKGSRSGGDPAQCNMMRSIRNDFSGERPHSECFIRFTGGQGRYAVVVRNELSRE